MQRTEKQDIYTRITNQIVSHLEKGVRSWVRPWNAEHAAGRITRPLRHNGKPYSGINVLSLWASAMAQNFGALIAFTKDQKGVIVNAKAFHAQLEKTIHEYAAMLRKPESTRERAAFKKKMNYICQVEDKPQEGVPA